MSTVSVADYDHVLTAIVPGAEIRFDTQHHCLMVNWGIRVTSPYMFAPTAEHAEQILVSLAEQVRLRAIRELGLRPILDVAEAEVNEYKQANHMLSGQLQRANDRIQTLEAQIYRYEHPDEDEYELISD